MRGRFATRLLWLIVLVLLIGAVVMAVVTRPEDVAGPCVVVQRTTSLPEVPEASGLAVSRRTPGILWSHNDSGHAAVRTADIARGGAVPAGFSIPIDGLKESQGEGVALDGNMLYLVSERRPWRRAGGFISLRCALP